ncbi:MAG: DNA polymerase I, partial [Clostridia bacterium]|nr:DNA polymerase I [Clostridia bacterium]
DYLNELSSYMTEKLAELEDFIYQLAGEPFNINSPKQLGEVLFAELGLPHGKKTKTGYSTNADILEKLKNVHPIVANILEYRQVAKLKSTYVDGLIAVINPKTGRIHSNFKQTVTATGRLSSTEPNLQNIPVRTPLGREMRKMFVAPEGRVFADADYSQIELRVLSHIAGDENMQSAFLNNIDVHTQTASQVFKVPLDSVTSEMRTSAKAVNFGIVYGISDYSLSQDLNISFKEAKQYIDGYFENYPNIKLYLDNVIKEGREKGYVSTIFGRRRYMPELRASNKITQSFGERVAMNAPIQGTAADIIKIAMVEVYKALKENNLKSKLILQIHDELIVESYPDELETVTEIVKTKMEEAAKLAVPLEVELNTGKSWYDTK